ncbi:hypothetical protein SOVF_083200, partial [Spinacia oleracea]
MGDSKTTEAILKEVVNL